MMPTTYRNVGRIILSGCLISVMASGSCQACETLIGNVDVKRTTADFQNVNYSDSSVLGMLLLLKEKVGSAGKALALVNCRMC